MAGLVQKIDQDFAPIIKSAGHPPTLGINLVGWQHLSRQQQLLWHKHLGPMLKKFY
jgi:hypothetical protein